MAFPDWLPTFAGRTKEAVSSSLVLQKSSHGQTDINLDYQYTKMCTVSYEISEEIEIMEKRGLQREIFPLILMLLLICTVNQGFCSGKDEPSGKSASMQISGSGTSADDPIVIKGASNGQEGVRLEYTTLAKRFPKCSQVSQRLIRYKDRPMDVIRIRLSNGTERDVFFDISDFFGKTASAATSSSNCTVSDNTSIFKDKTFLEYLVGLPEGKDVSSEVQSLAKEGKLKTIPKGTKVESLRTDKVKGADVIEIRIPNSPNAPGTWWILKTSLTCSH